MWWKRLFATKSIDELMVEIHREQRLRRVLGPGSLVSLGIGAIIGAGIFVLTGQAAAQYAGPAIVLSFIVAGIGCAFAGLCYAEMASMIPIAGSAYTYSYATMGELLAWIIGWDLILEYSFGAATVAVGWSGYAVSFLRDFGITIPPYLTAATGTSLIYVPEEGWKPLTKSLLEGLAQKGIDYKNLEHTTAWLNLPAVLIVFVVTIVLVIGIRESSFVNNLIVALKVGILVIFCLAGLAYLWRNPEVWRHNWDTFIPPNTSGKFGEYGLSGILRGAGVIFFAYIGFDSVSTAAQEARHPQRDMPIGILGSLAICTVIYISVATVLTSIVHYSQLNVPDPVAVGIDATGMKWLAPWVKIGALAGLTSVILVMLLSQPRIFWIMALDGLLPSWFSQVHPRFKTPHITTIVTGLFVATMAGMVPLGILGELVSIGTLLAFCLVCAGVLVLRYVRPEAPRPFRAPGMPFTALLGIAVCGAQMLGLPWDTWLRLLIWMALGLAIYFLYSMHHSKVGERLRVGTVTTGETTLSPGQQAETSDSAQRSSMGS
ncbi:MAG: amino acid permease [Gemmatales bacterium]|nr:amino acid permease [Gemmatales bacterium]MDW7993480.1 amino acid permease [Gemmatales bacterium]